RTRRGDRAGVGGEPRPARRGLSRDRRPASAARPVARLASRRPGRHGARVPRARAAASLAMLVHPDINPIAFSIGPVAVRWYGLMYLAGFAIGWWLGVRRIDRGVAPVTRAQFDDMIFYTLIGVILGGRLGYVLFYKPDYYLKHLGEVVAI